MRKNSTMQAGQLLLLFIAVASTIIFRSNVLITKMNWLLCLILFALESRLAVYATFFFGAFFTSAGFFQNLFFTVKHFHIAIWLLFVIELLKGDLWSRIKQNYSDGLMLIPWLGLLLISTISSFFQIDTISALRTNANILS